MVEPRSNVTSGSRFSAILAIAVWGLLALVAPAQEGGDRPPDAPKTEPAKPETPALLVHPWGDKLLGDRVLPRNAEEARALLEEAKKQAAAAKQIAPQSRVVPVLDRQVQLIDQIASAFSALDNVASEYSRLDVEKVEKQSTLADLQDIERSLAKEQPIESGPVDPAAKSDSESSLSMTSDALNVLKSRRAEAKKAAETVRENMGKLKEKTDAQLGELQAQSAIFTAKSADLTTPPDELEFLEERVYELELQNLLNQKMLARITLEVEKGLPELRVSVLDLKLAICVKELEAERRRLNGINEQEKIWRKQQIEESKKKREIWAKQIDLAPPHEKAYYELGVNRFELGEKNKEAEVELGNLKQKIDEGGELGLILKAQEELRDLIAATVEDEEESSLPESAKDLRELLDSSEDALETALKERADLRRNQKIDKQAIRGEEAERRAAIDKVRSAQREWEATRPSSSIPEGGEFEVRLFDPVTANSWKELEKSFLVELDSKFGTLRKQLATMDQALQQVTTLREVAEKNRSFLVDRLLWSRDESHISLASIETALSEGIAALDRIYRLPVAIYRHIAGFASSAKNEFRVIFGGIAILLLLLAVPLIHRKLPRTWTWFEARKRGHRFFHVLAVILRRTEISSIAVLILIGVPWAVGLTGRFIGVLAIIVVSPFLYRLGRVMNDVLFSPSDRSERLVIADDDLCEILHAAMRYLLNLAIFFVPAGLLMERLGYASRNQGFVELWWLAWKSLTQIVILLTIFRPGVVRRILRGDNVVVSSFRNWILIGYPLVLAGALFVFVLGSLRFEEAEAFFTGLFLRTLGYLVGGYVAYRVVLRSLVRSRDVDRKINAEDFESPRAFQEAGRSLFYDRLLRFAVRFGTAILVGTLIARAWSELESGILQTSITGTLDGLTLSNLFWAVVAIVLTSVVVSLQRQFLTFVLLPRLGLDQGSSYTVVTLAAYLVATIGIIATLNILRVQGEQIAVVVSALMLGIGFGLQSIVKNFVSGLILLVERPVQVGDLVEVEGSSGVVEKITLRATSVMTYDGVGIVIPNEVMIGSSLRNQSLGKPRLRVSLEFGVAYGSNPQRVRELVSEIVNNHGLVLKRPAPEVFFVGFGNSSLDFRALFWTSLETHRMRVASDLRFAIEAAFRREKIEIPFPQQDIWIRGMPEEKAPVEEVVEEAGKARSTPAVRPREVLKDDVAR